MKSGERCLWGSRVLVTGWGRVAKILALRLYALGALVTVAARKDGDRAMARALGLDSCDYDGIYEQAEEFDLEDMRVMLADSYFSVINPYLQITFRQVERLFAQPGLYVEEIDKTLEQLNRIYALAQEYEEPICSPPAFLQQLNP